MPKVVYDRLNHHALAPTAMCLLLADQSVRYPAGVAENIPVKIRNFLIPVDFLVLDMEVDTKAPLILGRPFLSTANASIDVGAREIQLNINGQKETFTFKPKVEQCSQVKAINRKKKSEKKPEKPSIPPIKARIKYVESLRIQEEAKQIKLHNYKNAREGSNVRNFWNRERKRSNQNPHPRRCGGRKGRRQELHPATSNKPKRRRVRLRTQNPSPRQEVHGMYPSSHCI